MTDAIDNSLLDLIAGLDIEIEQKAPLLKNLDEEVQKATLDRNYAIMAVQALRHQTPNTAAASFQDILRQARRRREQA